ncbi:MAG: MaoC family dehydratase N-terminal domain-containing protein [Myxococcales bacterium]|nr:MaoC family dehydratase N-terminal domain-containing protein [Myxococcales bacterium]
MQPIGKTYDGGVFTVEPGMGTAYAAATDDHDASYSGPDAVAPPMFHVRPCIGLMMQCARDPELGIDFLRLVHGEHTMRFQRLLRDGDTVALTGELLSVDEKSSGTLFTFALRGTVDGTPAFDGETTYFIRAAKKADGPKKPRPPAEPPPTPTWTASQPVTADQAHRYAAASGDHNPIHLDAAVATKAGLPGVILHGLCTLAFAQRDLVARYCPGEPGRLASLGVRFAAPVFPGDTLTLQVWETEGGRVAFQTLDGRGKPVLTGGSAEIR